MMCGFNVIRNFISVLLFLTTSLILLKFFASCWMMRKCKFLLLWLDNFGGDEITGFVKLNWDAALTTREQKLGMGFIARDQTGRVLVAHCASKLLYISDPGIAEALAAWKMVEVACCQPGVSSCYL